MARCASCKKPLKETTTMHAVAVGPKKTVRVEIPALRCTGCDEVVTDYDDMKKAEFAVARAVIDAGWMNGASFRFLRKVIGMRAKDVAAFLGSTPETISRWENGQPVDRNTWLLLAMLVLGRATQDDSAQRALEAVEKPGKLPEQVSLKLAS